MRFTEKEKRDGQMAWLLLLMPGWTGGQHYGRWQPGRPMPNLWLRSFECFGSTELMSRFDPVANCLHPLRFVDLDPLSGRPRLITIIYIQEHRREWNWMQCSRKANASTSMSVSNHRSFQLCLKLNISNGKKKWSMFSFSLPNGK